MIFIRFARDNRLEKNLLLTSWITYSRIQIYAVNGILVVKGGNSRQNNVMNTQRITQYLLFFRFS